MMDVSTELIQVVESAAARLKLLDEARVRTKPNPAKWSILEILGHLIDSAANNHQRFVRAQAVDVLIFPEYQQDNWVGVQGYNERPWLELVDLWRLYNRHLAHVIARIPEASRSVECHIGPNEPATLEYVFEHYLVHLKHHLGQIEAMSAS